MLAGMTPQRPRHTTPAWSTYILLAGLRTLHRAATQQRQQLMRYILSGDGRLARRRAA